MKYKHIIIIFLLLICSGTTSAWLPGYEYRMQIDINNTGNDLTHYQYNFTVNTQSLTSAGKMDADGKDCRVTDSSDVVLNWWNETSFNSALTKIWVKAPSLGNVTNTTHYIYYGNSTVSYTGNIKNTGAKPSDDFNDGSVDSNIWNTTDSTATLTESGGTLRVHCTGTQWLRGEGGVVPTNVRIIQLHKSVTKLGYSFPFSDGIGDPFGDTNYIITGPSYFANKIYLDTDGAATHAVAQTLFLNTYYYMMFTKSGTAVKCNVYNSAYTYLNGLDDTITNAPTGRYYCFRTSDDDSYFDFIFTTNYTTPEPTTSLGAEGAQSFTPISISSPSPGTSATKYVSNKTITYSAIPSKTADNKWSYGNGTFIEWDNSTTSPSMEMWINSSTIKYFNISLTSYTSGNNSDNAAESWNNSITDDIFDSTNYTWSRWDELPLEGWIGYTGNIEVGDVDNDGADEIIVVGTIAGSAVNNRDMIFYDLDSTKTRYADVTSTNYQFTEASVHDVTEDGINEMLCIFGKATTPPDGISDLYRFNTSGLNGSYLNNDIMTSGSNNPKAISWIDVNNDEHYYSCGCGAGETVNCYTTLSSHSATEIDDFTISAEDNIVWDIDGDGQMELLVVEGWSAGNAKIWMYEINNATGAYTSKTMLFDNNSIGGTHFSCGIHTGDIDNDGIDNLIIHWLGATTCYQAPYRIEAYEFDGITHFGEGNFSESIVIDTTTNFCSRGHGKTFVADIDNDGLNELVTGAHMMTTIDSYPLVMNSYDITSGGASITKNELVNCSIAYMSAASTYTLPTITPAFISQGKFVIAVHKERQNAAALETEIYILESKNTSVLDYIPPTPINILNTTGSDWVNHTWSAGSGNVTDSYNVSINTVWHNTTPTYYNNTGLSVHAWSNITVYAYNSSGIGILSSVSVSQNTQVSTTPLKYIPPNPINIINNTGSDWIKHLWDVGTGNVTDSYNVCVNNIWYNGTINTYYKKTYTKDNWQNITVFAYNNSAGGTLSLSSISQNTFLEYTGTQYFSKLKTMITEIIPLLSDVLLLVIAYVPVLIGIVMVSFIMSICIGVFGKLKRW